MFFFSNEGSEPPHIHVQRGDKLAKYWLDPVELARSRGFTKRELTTIRTIVIENERFLLEAWHESFGKR